MRLLAFFAPLAVNYSLNCQRRKGRKDCAVIGSGIAANFVAFVPFVVRIYPDIGKTVGMEIG
jgi:hypothetical protein